MISLMEVKMDSEDKYQHQPVMLEEALKGLDMNPDGVYVDATFGRGGHARAILQALNQQGRLLVIDRDPSAIAVAKRLQATDERLMVQQGAFSKLYVACEVRGLVGKVDGVLMDVGVSSPQLEEVTRGFSFKQDGPLDMRMDPTTGISAQDWLNTAKESEIAFIFKTYGEERFYRRMAKAVVKARTIALITSTQQLAAILTKANPAWEKSKHPARRCFQAIRIFINDELNELSLGLNQALAVLKPGGRLVVISFHSLEDRIVKRFIQTQEKGDEYPARLPIAANQLHQLLRRVGRKILPSSLEIAKNPRARSAVLRVAEKSGATKK